MKQLGGYPDIFQVDITEDTMKRASDYIDVLNCALSTAVKDVGFKGIIHCGHTVLHINNEDYDLSKEDGDKIIDIYYKQQLLPLTVTLKKRNYAIKQ